MVLAPDHSLRSAPIETLRDVLCARAEAQLTAGVVTESLAFNLLMGRRLPPSEKDLAEAESACRDLGLGELLERMPAGLQQVAGETGWRLSQGDKSRVVMVRALLQGSGLVILTFDLPREPPLSNFGGCQTTRIARHKSPLGLKKTFLLA